MADGRRGGRRPGAGRKPGSKTIKRRAAQAKLVAIADKVEVAPEIKAAAANMTPLEVMLANMRHYYQVALDAEEVLKGLSARDLTGLELSEKEQFEVILAEVRKTVGFRDLAQGAAKDAASYVHARLAAIEQTVTNKTGDMNADQLRAFIRAEIADLGVSHIAPPAAGGGREAGRKPH